MPPLSVRQLTRHISDVPAGAFSLRSLLRRPTGPLRLCVQASPFSVMTHNMGLLVSPGNYLGTDREGAIAEIITQIRALSPDVVGLCEVFDDDERGQIREALADTYPHYQEGPDEDDLESDGGLLLLSKHPLIAASSMIYRDCDGSDCYANKGMIHIRVRPASFPEPVDVFFTHAQDISTSEGVDTLYAQLDRMSSFIQQHGSLTAPRIIMGDLNIPGESAQHYAQLLNRLKQPRDCWTLAGNSPASGFTCVLDNNFYEDADDRPEVDQRLDYVLTTAGMRFVPILKNIQVLKIKRNGRFISDHFGLHALFDKFAVVWP